MCKGSWMRSRLRGCQSLRHGLSPCHLPLLGGGIMRYPCNMRAKHKFSEKLHVFVQPTIFELKTHYAAGIIKGRKVVFKMLFSKKIEPRCEYCRSAVPFSDVDVVGCKYRGVMSISDKCRRFVYDPLKRVPDPPRSFTPREYDKEDFEL